jgi:type I restriction enzyme R subunit
MKSSDRGTHHRFTNCGLRCDETLRIIAQELLRAVRNSATIDWTVRENVRANMRVIIKRILRRYGYPPDMQAKATELVVEQAEALCKEWEN